MTSTPPLLARRRVLGATAATAGAGLAGISSLVLPTATAAASSVDPSGVPSSSLVFHLDASLPGDTPGSVWADLSGNGNTGATTGAGITHVTASSGVPAHYSLDGSATASIMVAAGATIVGTAEVPPTAYTKMVWFRRDVTGDYHNLISSASTGAPHYLWFRESSYLRLTAGHDSTAGAQQATYEVGSAIWTFGAVTFSTVDGMRILTNSSDRTWSNGSLSEDIGFPGYTTAPSAAMSFQVGGYAGAALLQGDVATAVVHARALSVTEVRDYYAATVDRFHPV